MAKGELILLISLFCYSVIAFLPIWREIELGGMAVFGWMMAFLMLVAPIFALLIIRSSDKHSAADSDESQIGDA